MPSINASMSVATFKEKVDGFVNCFHQKADQSFVEENDAAINSDLSARYSFIMENTDQAARDSFVEVNTFVDNLKTSLENADNNIEAAVFQLSADATTATQAVQAGLDAYIVSNEAHINDVAGTLTNSVNLVGSNLATYQTSNDARVAEVEEKVDYVAEQLPQASGGSSSQA